MENVRGIQSRVGTVGLVIGSQVFWSWFSILLHLDSLLCINSAVNKRYILPVKWYQVFLVRRGGVFIFILCLMCSFVKIISWVLIDPDIFSLHRFNTGSAEVIVTLETVVSVSTST